MTKQTTAFIHGLHVRDRKTNTNVALVKEKVCDVDDTGVVTYTDRLRAYNDPTRPFWVTKPTHRTHQYKKEFEYTGHLDRYETRDSVLGESLKLALDIQSPRFKLRELFDNPYVYGADIESLVFIKHKYMKEVDTTIPVKLSVGCLDIENEIGGKQRILAITYIHETEVYTAALKEYMVNVHPTTNDRTAASVDDVYIRANELITPLVEQHGFKLHISVFDSELDIIKYIFSKIHEHKTDFIGIWNMRHDIPYILKRLEFHKVDPASVLCPPSLPANYKLCRYRASMVRKNQHITDRWDWFYCSGYSQFIDAMCLYSRLRKVGGREPSYSLDAISTKELGTGKLKLNGLGNHTWEQKNNFVTYVVYNIVDTILMQIMEKKNHDYDQMLALAGVTTLDEFSRQSAMCKNNTFFYAYPLGKVIASTGFNMLTPFDELLVKSGGAVLNPNRVLDIGIAAISEAPDIETKVCIGVNDLDVTAEYPSILATFNISKETKESTAYSIVGHPSTAVEHYFSNIVSPTENSISLCNQFFSLPGYKDMDKLFSKYVTARLRDSAPIDLDLNDSRDLERIEGWLEQVFSS